MIGILLLIEFWWDFTAALIGIYFSRRVPGCCTQTVKVLKILIQRGGAVEREVEWEQRSDRERIVIKQLKLKLRRVRPEGRKTGSGEIVRLNCLSLELVLLTILADNNGIEASNRDELNSFSTGVLFSKKLT